MVSRSAPALTKLGFRRDVRLFLGALVGFLVVLILVLLLLLQNVTNSAQAALTHEWNVVADAAVADVAAAGATDVASLRARLDYLRARYDIAGIEITRANERPIAAGTILPPSDDDVMRTTPLGTMRFIFENTELQSLRTAFRRTAIITLAATVIGAILLLLFLRRVTRPIEQLLGEAQHFGSPAPGVDEERYLLDTFKASLAKLKEQEAELQRLHDEQKSRADELERVTATLTRSLTSGFIAVDVNGMLLDANAAARQILNLDPDATFAGRTIRRTLGDREFGRVLQKAVDERLPLSRFEVSDGDQVIGITTVPLLGDDGAFLGLIALFTDLTHVRVLEQRVHHMAALSELGEIAAGIAHEFRNSLSTILGYLRLALRQEDRGAIAERVRKAEDEGNALSAAVDRLLNFARPLSLEKTPVDVRALAADVAERSLGRDGAPEWNISGPPVVVNGDAALLSRAIENVLRNAEEAIRDAGLSGIIEIETVADPPSLVIRDNGTGIDPDSIQRMLLPFQTGKASGVGLGLPLARKIALVHGGDLRLENRDGGGAMVTIELEAHAPAARADAARA